MVGKIGAKQEPLSNLYLTAVEEKTDGGMIFFLQHTTQYLLCFSSASVLLIPE